MYELTPHQAVALNTKNSISLTANAGSGKTFVLANRYLKVILETNISIHEIAAITFTEKAAGELYSRIADELGSLIKRRNPAGIQNKIEKLRNQLVSANISTIHSFCVDLLKEFPVEASLDANFIPIDQRKADELVELSTEYVIRNKISRNVEDVKLLIRLIGSKRGLSRELAGLIRNRKNLFQVKEHYSDKSPAEIADFLKKQSINGLQGILKIELPDIIVHFNKINEKVLLNDSENIVAIKVKDHLDETIEMGDNFDVLRSLAALKEEAFIKNGSLKSRGYLNNNLRVELDQSAAIVERFFKEFEKLFLIDITNNVEVELAKYSIAMLDMAFDVIEEYEDKKKQLGYLDFEDILLKAKEILGKEDVQREISKKYKYLLIDEYQDTNEIQYKIFLPVVDYLRTGNMFIVGDEKQSIYRFRDAELEIFGRTKADIKKASKENLTLTLPDSFRMAPALCLFTNHIFKRLFANPQGLYGEVEHKDLVCARTDSFDGKIEFLISSDDDDIEEAELVVKRIIKLKNEYDKEITDWGNIAVLVRKRSAFSELEKTFIKYNIPFTIIGGTGFYQKQCISDIYNYLAFLFDNNDDAALIGLLRSPFFSVSDIEIFQLSIFNGDSYWEKLLNAAKADEYWKPFYTTIKENLNLSKRISIPSLLQKILNESCFLSTIASRINGAQEINNIYKLISITIKFFDQDFNSFYDYLAFLKSSIGSFIEESQAVIDDRSNCVHVMTIHQAKGLQYSAVFLYRCNDTSQSENIKSKSFKVDKSLGLLTKIPRDGNFFGEYFSAPVVELYNFIENKKSKAELKRLLYVGITRAKNFLFISAKDANHKSNKLNSFMDLLSHALEIELDQSNLSLQGNLDFLIKNDDVFKVVSREMKIKIPLYRDVELKKIKEQERVDKKFSQNYLIEAVNDNSKGEIISATKFSVFKDCPLKYNLIYNLNLHIIVKDYNKWLKSLNNGNDYGFNHKEQQRIIFEESNAESFIPFDIKGRIIHRLLEVRKPKEDIRDTINSLIDSEKFFRAMLFQSNRHWKEEILLTVNKFLESKESSFLNSFSKFRNELEVYCKEEDFYLFGIIDKVLFAGNKLIVVDYKTDRIEESEISERGKRYLSQLYFYSVVLKKIYPSIKEIEIRIIFLDYPDLPVVKKFEKNSENKTLSDLKKMIISIRNNNYSVNLDHCSQCIFCTDENSCIM